MQHVLTKYNCNFSTHFTSVKHAHILTRRSIQLQSMARTELNCWQLLMRPLHMINNQIKLIGFCCYFCRCRCFVVVIISIVVGHFIGPKGLPRDYKQTPTEALICCAHLKQTIILKYYCCCCCHFFDSIVMSVQSFK